MTALPAPFAWEGPHIGADLGQGHVLFTTRSLDLRDPADLDRLAAEIGRAPRHARQVHGADVLLDAEPGQEADGQVVTEPDAAAVVFTADCLPVALVADGAVAMLHGGWRGLAAGILAEGVRVLRAAGAAGPVSAALGPSARGCCYEVGEEVHAVFAGCDARRGDRRLALDAVAARQLAGVGVEMVHDTGLCTMCTPERFYSHRRDHGRTGRQGGVAWRS